TYAIDLDRELHVLAGTKALPVGVGTQHEAEDVAGLRADRLDPRQDAVQAELRAELARIEVEHALVEEQAQDRRRQQAGEGRGEARERGGVGCRAVRPPRGHVMSSRESGGGRGQLGEVGRKVFAERGYEATSVEEIAERAGISKPIVYEHFGGKEGLYAVIVDREIEYIVSCIVEAISKGSPRERLERAAL